MVTRMQAFNNFYGVPKVEVEPTPLPGDPDQDTIEHLEEALDDIQEAIQDLKEN